MSKWQSGFVEANGIKLHYTRTGGDKPPLVLAHGVTDDGLCWTPVAGALASEYDVVMVDARGHGRSDAPEGGYSLTALAADLAGVIAALELRQPAILGHSMGAATSARPGRRLSGHPGGNPPRGSAGMVGRLVREAGRRRARGGDARACP